MAILSIVVVPTKEMANGRNRIRISVAHRSQTRYISTQFVLDSSKQLKNGKVVKHENADRINHALRKIIYEYEEILSEASGLSSLSCTEVVHLLLNKREKKEKTFNDVMQEYLSTMQTEDRHKSYKLYKIAGGKLMKYMKGNFALSIVSPALIEKYSQSLEEEKLSSTSIRIYLSLIKVLLNYAIKMNYVSYSVHPFTFFKMPIAHIREIDLSVEEIRLIRDVNLTKSVHVYTRDVFLLTYYLGGMNLRDLMAYNFQNQTEMRYIRHKTRQNKKDKTFITFTIQPEAAEIINRYIQPNGKLSFGPYHTYEKVYSMVFRYLNTVACLAGITRKVSYYSARKSFAQHGYELGIPIERIEYCIGHSMKTNRPIFNYIRIMREHADKAFRMILDELR